MIAFIELTEIIVESPTIRRSSTSTAFCSCYEGLVLAFQYGKV